MPRPLLALSDPITLGVGALAVHRLTRLITDDTIVDGVRDAIIERNPEGRLAYLVTCPWCASVWVAGGWAALAVVAPKVARPLGAVLAWSSAAGLLLDRE